MVRRFGIVVQLHGERLLAKRRDASHNRSAVLHIHAEPSALSAFHYLAMKVSGLTDFGAAPAVNGSIAAIKATALMRLKLLLRILMMSPGISCITPLVPETDQPRTQVANKSGRTNGPSAPLLGYL
jgi:hypothetical protein